nr:O-antigen ligase family protein [uncultured Blautia sp.]
MEKIVWFLLLMWNFEPPYFKELEWLDQFYIMGRFAAVYVLLLIVLMKGKKYRPGKFVIYLGLMEAVLAFSTFWNGGYSLVSFLMNEVTGISFIVLLDYMFTTDVKLAVSVLTVHYEILIYGNFVTVFLFPQGLYNLGTGRNYWLLGQVNQIVLYILPGIMLALLRECYVLKKERPGIRFWILMLISTVMSVKVWSATSVVGLVLFLALIIVGEIWKIQIDIKWGILLSLAVFTAFVLWRIQDIFSWLIVNILHRNLTFSTRTTVWDHALNCIKEKWFLGYGEETLERAVERFGYMTPHNRYLYLMYKGGCILTAVFGSMVYSGRNILQKFGETKGALYISACMISLFLMMQFESYNTTVFWVPFLVMFQTGEVVEERELI